MSKYQHGTLLENKLAGSNIGIYCDQTLCNDDHF